MRHRVAHRKLGRVTEHRLATLRNQAQMLLRHERIDTTLAKAKELRPFVERLITVAKRGLADGADTTRALHARRLVARDLADKQVARKLFDTIAPRFSSRPGGYTRVLHLGRRQGDCAEVAQIELVGSEYDPNADQSSGTAGEAAAGASSSSSSKGVGGRLRAAAKRLRGGEKTDAKKGADTEQ
ncbi:MAG: 50S ribosomal protein L17 [Acidobacteria bacterium]|jgi:large subunit ribosomal protein L17|nr:50S ribosomal protein L17 [Acidobacteriota bacterium]|tara:strand:+ start:3311 stop:3862 length:552 start_codon:yes stop_codon:yes gene_type:complete